MVSVVLPEVKVQASSVSAISTSGLHSLSWNFGQWLRSSMKFTRRVVMMFGRGLVTSMVRMPPSSVCPGWWIGTPNGQNSVSFFGSTLAS